MSRRGGYVRIVAWNGAVRISEEAVRGSRTGKKIRRSEPENKKDSGGKLPQQERTVMVIETNDARGTSRLGEVLGKLAEPGQIYTMVGDLGVGKTVFTQGFARGLGIREAVNSPTFTIVQVYEEGRLPFYHFDVYRIGDIEEMEEIGYDDYFFGEGVCLIEWADLIREILPETVIAITIQKDLEKGFDYRKITVNGLPEELEEQLEREEWT